MKSPKHVAIIMDGNGRWARERKLPRFMGHRAGGKVVHKIVEHALKRSVEVLTLFAFSLENHARPVSEVEFLMKLFQDYLEQFCQKLCDHQVGLRVVGEYDYFSPSLLKTIEKTNQKTQQACNGKPKMILVLAVHYSGRWDIMQAVKKIAQQVKNAELNVEQINQQLISQQLSLCDLPDPDLLIRTSGEKRISNFMLWQFAYTEFYFSSVFWPDFSAHDFDHALAAFAERSRRFGLTPEQAEQHHA